MQLTCGTGGIIGSGNTAENPYVESITDGDIHRCFSACAFAAYPLNRRVVSCSTCNHIPLQLHLQTCSKQHDGLSNIPKKEVSRPRNETEQPPASESLTEIQ